MGVNEFSGLDPNQFTFGPEWASVEHGLYDAIVTKPAEILYLRDRTNRSDEQQVGRLDLNAASVNAFREQLQATGEIGMFPLGPGDGADAEPPADGGTASDGGTAKRARGAAKTQAEAERRMIANAAVTWLRYHACREAGGTPNGVRLRVQCFGPKSVGSVWNGTFRVTDRELPSYGVGLDDGTDGGKVSAGSLPEPSWPQGMQQPFVGHMQAMLAASQAVVRLVLQSLGQVNRINTTIISGQQRQIGELQRMVSGLHEQSMQVSALVQEDRLAQAYIERRAANQQKLGSDALALAEKAVTAWFGGKTVNPRIVSLLAPLTSDPKFMAIMSSAKVQKLMSNDDMRGAILDVIAAQAEDMVVDANPPGDKKGNDHAQSAGPAGAAGA